MKLKHIFAAALTLCAASVVSATDISQLRIYVNPGHGSWTGGDRNMGTVKRGPANTADTTGFYESNTNLWKGLELTRRLADYGLTFDPTKNQNNSNPARRGAALDLTNNVVMSHVKCGPYPHNAEHASDYNRNLYEIACEVERNNFDFFISVHSNAHVDGNNTNYPAFFVRGENRVASVEGSDDACRTFWPFAYQDEHATWSNFSMSNVALYYDVDFWNGDYAINNIDGKTYKGYYGVLRHGVKGFLVEGYFHTYQPGRHRAMNPDVCRHEGLEYAHGFAAQFGLTTEPGGEIYGIVRDRHERFKHTFYNCKSTSFDAYKPLNNAVVTLYRDGAQVATYTTDDEYNGAFLFRDLEPGQYTISVTADGYFPAEEDYCGPFTVEAAKTVYPRVYLTSESYEPPAIEYFDYPDPAAGTSMMLGSKYNLSRTFTDKVSASLKNMTVKRFIERNGRLYILAYDAENKPNVVVLNEGNLSKLAVVSTTGCEGTDRDLADIQVTSDGVLIGCSMELCHLTADDVDEGEERGVCNIYRWANNSETGLPEGDPKIWFTTQMTGNLYKAWTGRSMAYTGTFQEGRMILSSASWWYNKKIFFTIIDVAEGKKAGESFSNKAEVCDYFNADDLQEFTFTISPLDSGSFITESNNKECRQYTIDNMHLEGTLSTDLLPAASEQAGYFRMAGHSMMVAPATDAEGKNIGISLFDITDGLDNAKLIRTINGDLEPTEGVAAATGRCMATVDDEGNVTDTWMDLYLIRNNGRLTRFTTKGVEQPVSVPAYAYDLETNHTPGDPEELAVFFKLTDDATVHIRVRNVETGTTVDLPSFEGVKGLNNTSINFGNFESGTSEWSVVVENETVSAVKELWRETVAGNGVAIDDNEASPFFGNVYFTLYEGSRGIKVYTPALESQNETPYQSGVWDLTVGASCWRANTLEDGTLLVSDWGDQAGGIYVFDPADPTAARKPFFIGSQNPANGEITNADGQVIAGSTPGMDFIGSGENQVMYSFQEDYPSDYTLTMASYNIGTAHQWSSIPDATYPNMSAVLINGNVNVVTTDKALFLSQTRGAGNNATGAPSFIIATYNDEILYNSGRDWEGLNGSDGALAVNSDASLMALTDATRVLHVLEITWEPQLALKEIATYPLNSSACYQMAFDRAGRLFVATRGFNAVYAVPQKANEAVTTSTEQFVATGAGIENVTVDNNAPVEYYNLQGIRVENPSGGIFIRRQGNNVTKVMIR